MLGALCSLAVTLAVVWINLVMVHTTHDRISRNPKALAERPIAVVLGSQPGNEFTNKRLEAAARLYHTGIVRLILASGSNPTRYYNEPEAMKVSLIQLGVPAQAIVCDFAGFRTLDSVARAKYIFQIQKCIFVTQEFHLARTLYLARHHGIDGLGYSAEDASSWSARWQVGVREIAARVMAWLDIHLLATQPRYLGERQPLPLINSGQG